MENVKRVMFVLVISCCSSAPFVVFNTNVNHGDLYKQLSSRCCVNYRKHIGLLIF